MVEKINPNEKAQVEFIGQRIEQKIMVGEAVFINEVERMWIRGLLEKRGVDFGGVEVKELALAGSNKHNVVEPNELVRILGRERFALTVERAMRGVTKKENQQKLDGFVDSYLEKHTGPDGVIVMDLNSGEVNDAKIVGIVSAMDRLVRVLTFKDPELALAIQRDGQTNLLLRERMLRRREKTTSIDSSNFEIPRDGRNGKLRTLAENGVEAIFEALMSLEDD